MRPRWRTVATGAGITAAVAVATSAVWWWFGGYRPVAPGPLSRLWSKFGLS